MSVHAGTILHVGGNNVIDRIQSAGLGDARVPMETIREVGNDQIVDKIPGDPDFTFTLESFDVSTELEAMLTGAWGGTGSGAAPGFADADGTEYKWSGFQNVNIASPWKDPATGSAGVITAGHLVPGYYINRCRYRFGVTDNATQEIELGGGSYYYADGAPVEDHFVGDGATVAFNSTQTSLPHRIGGATGTSFRRVFGVLVNGELQIRGVDYNDGPDSNANATAVVTFTTAPATGASIKFAYFTNAAVSWPDSRHASVVVKPAAVRGRHIVAEISTDAGATWTKIGSVQSAELEATVEGEVEREFDNEEIVGRTINGRDCTGSITVRSKNAGAFLTLLSEVTGVAATEVIGWLNTHDVRFRLRIRNPKNPAQILKTLYVPDAIFQVPGTPARVNTPTDFVYRWESREGDFSVFKGDMP